MARERVNMRLPRGIIDTLKELSHLGTGDEADTMTGVVEQIVSHWIFTNYLQKNDVVWKVTRARLINSPEETCAFYAAMCKAERGEPGYKIHRLSKIGVKIEGDDTPADSIVAIDIPDPNDPDKTITI